VPRSTDAEKLAEIRQKLAALPSDSDRVRFLIELSLTTQKDNPKLALRFMDDARTLVSRKATSYTDFENQIKVADAYAALDAKKSFEVLEPGIAQLNELLAAAEVLNDLKSKFSRWRIVFARRQRFGRHDRALRAGVGVAGQA